jgi:hypothetical protein
MDINELISRINLKIVIRIAVSAAVFILLLIIAGIMINRAAEQKYYSQSGGQAREKDRDLPDITFGPDDLKFPREYTQTPEFKWRPFRKTSEVWSSEEIKRFWKDPADVIIEVYADENREYIEKILEDVP